MPKSSLAGRVMEFRSTAERSTPSSRARASMPSMEIASAIFSYIQLKPSSITREICCVMPAGCGCGGGGAETRGGKGWGWMGLGFWFESGPFFL
jgi:hypothetical protein